VSACACPPSSYPGPSSDAARARGLIDTEQCADAWAVIQGCYANLLSDKALTRVINSGVIAHDERGDAGAILRGRAG
jgi:hypothetical protein